MEAPVTPPPISPEELDAVLATARAEQWPALATLELRDNEDLESEAILAAYRRTTRP